MRVRTVLKQRRAMMGWTQAEVAKRASVTRFYISLLESGTRRQPSLLVRKRLAKALDVPLTMLLD
jgi:transcriptional regulator with XRE-family HTH domain